MSDDEISVGYIVLAIQTLVFIGLMLVWFR